MRTIYIRTLATGLIKFNQLRALSSTFGQLKSFSNYLGGSLPLEDRYSGKMKSEGPSLESFIRYFLPP